MRRNVNSSGRGDEGEIMLSSVKSENIGTCEEGEVEERVVGELDEADES